MFMPTPSTEASSLALKNSFRSQSYCTRDPGEKPTSRQPFSLGTPALALIPPLS